MHVLEDYAQCFTKTLPDCEIVMCNDSYLHLLFSNTTEVSDLSLTFHYNKTINQIQLSFLSAIHV